MSTFDHFCAQLHDQTTRTSLQEKTSGDLAKRQRVRAMLPDSEYAVVVRHKTASVRRYPMFSEDDWVSSVAYLDAIGAAELPPRLVKQAAARLHRRGIELEIEAPRILEKLASVAAGEPPVAVEWESLEAWFRPTEQVVEKRSGTPLAEWVLEGIKDETGAPIPFQVYTLADLTKAESWLETNVTKLSSTDRRRAAQGILQGYQRIGFPIKSRAFVEKLSSAVKAYGGARVRRNAAGHILDRVSALEKTSAVVRLPEARVKMRRAYEVLAEALHPDITQEEVEKIAARVDTLDRLSGIEYPISAHQSIFYAIDESPGLRLQKTSSDDAEVVFSSGATMLRGADLKKAATLPLQKLEEYLGEEAVQEFRKAPVAVFKSLPAPHRKVVAAFVEEQVVSRHRGADPVFE